jgi:hypothetical protein
MSKDKKLFEKDFDPIICKMFGKKKQFDQETLDKAANSEEQYAVNMGIEEIKRIRTEIESMIEKLKDLVLAEDLINELLEIDTGFEYMTKVLTYDFNPLKMISEGQEGVNSYKEMMYARKQWISELLEKYGQSGEEN